MSALRRSLARRASVAVLLTMAAPALASAKDYANADLKFSVTIPDDCAVEETTGTLEAICAPDRDPSKTTETPKARAVFLEIDAEHVPLDAKPYGEAEFRADIPDAVCGAGDAAEVKIENVVEAPAGTSRVFTATVVCPAIAFLGLEERRAAVRYVIGSKMRYRLMYRAPSVAHEKNAAAGKAFFDSFKSTAE